MEPVRWQQCGFRCEEMSLKGVALALLVLGIACGDATAPMTELVQAQRRWAEHGPASYVLTVQRSCFCALESLGPVRVEVVNGVIQSRRYLDGTLVDSRFADSFPDVPGLFAMVLQTISRGPAHFAVEYDALFGFPEEYSVDYATSLADDEMSISTTLSTTFLVSN